MLPSFLRSLSGRRAPRQFAPWAVVALFALVAASSAEAQGVPASINTLTTWIDATRRPIGALLFVASLMCFGSQGMNAMGERAEIKWSFVALGVILLGIAGIVVSGSTFTGGMTL